MTLLIQRRQHTAAAAGSLKDAESQRATQQLHLTTAELGEEEPDYYSSTMCDKSKKRKTCKLHSYSTALSQAGAWKHRHAVTRDWKVKQVSKS